MARYKTRNARANLVSWYLETENGWNREIRDIPGAVASWKYRFPDLPIVSDGREETGHTRAGRGTTAFDLFRRVEMGSIYRNDFLSIKTETIAEDGKLPSRLDLSTGNVETLNALIRGIEAGASLPTLIFASENDENNDPSPEGFALILDLGQVLRGGIAPVREEPYAKGEAPNAYYRWASARPCGGEGKHYARAHLDFPHVDEQGRKWVRADRVCYQELTCSLSSLGYSRKDWVHLHLNEVQSYVNSLDWDMM